MELSAKKIEQLNVSLGEIGFEKKTGKTTNLNVRTDYARGKDKSGDCISKIYLV